MVVKKVLEQGWDTRTTHYTHVGPMTPYIVVDTVCSVDNTAADCYNRSGCFLHKQAIQDLVM